MPNAPMADPEYRKRYEIETDPEGFVEATFSFTRADYDRMFDLGMAYKLFIKIGLARYLAYFMQVDRGILALDFVEKWLDESLAHPELYPVSHHVRTRLLPKRLKGRAKDWFLLNWHDGAGRFLFNRLDGFYRELLTIYERTLAADVGGSDLAAVVAAQKAVLPKKDRVFPETIPLAHDVVSYFQALRRAPIVNPRPEGLPLLRDYGPGVLTLKEQPPSTTYAHADVDPHGNTLELASDLWI